MALDLGVRWLGCTDYETSWRAMQTFTATRDARTRDECWITEHPAVYSLGLNRQNVRLPERQDIPLVLVDRGGKITYHGQGHLVVYQLMDLKRKGLTVRQIDSGTENAIISLLAEYGVSGQLRSGAPGVYVADKKIASLGFRIRNQCCYHGLALNVDMDLTPFDAIDPCGYQGLQVTQIRDVGISINLQQAGEKLLKNLMEIFDYKALTHEIAN